MEKVRIWVSMTIAFLLCVTIAIPMVTDAATPGGIPCNEFRPNEPFGVLTDNCSKGDGIANELLSEANILGVMGSYNQTNATVAGRFSQFTLNKENMSIDSYAAWSNGALYQVFDTIMFYDATSMSSNLMGPIFNGTFDKTNIRIQNHPSGIITIATEQSVRIKLTMSGGINSSPVDANLLNKSFAGAMHVGSENISSIVMVKQGSMMMAGNRSIIVDLAKGGEMFFKAASDTSEQQSKLLDGVLQGSVLTEYWMVVRDDGAIYSVVAYNDVDFALSNCSVRLGSWVLKLPQQAMGKVVLIEMDKMSFTTSGEADTMFSVNGSKPAEVDNVAQVLAAARNGGNASLFYQQIVGSTVSLALFIPNSTTGTTPVETGGGDTNNETALNIPSSWFVAGGILLIAVVAGVAFLVRRSRRK